DVSTTEASVVRALEWIYTQRGSHSIAAVNLSLGSPPQPAPCSGSAAMTSIVGQLNAAGIAVVAASGNDGSTSGLSFPACMFGVISVGSVSASGLASAKSNTHDNITLLAPGENVETATTGGSYRSVSGTSFSAPQVSGAIAVLRNVVPTWSVSSIVALLDRTSQPVLVPATGRYLRGGALRLDRAIDPDFRVEHPVALTQPGSPIGTLDIADLAPGGIRVAGWALDPDTVAPVSVHVYVDGTLRAVTTAASPRADVAAAFPGWGSPRGYDQAVPVADGDHTVCTYGIDAGPGSGNVLLGCRGVRTGVVIGSLDVVQPSVGGARVAGWSLDRGTAAPTHVHVYVDGGFAASVLASVSRPDIAAAFPGYGAAHGFDLNLALSGGRRTVCVYAIEVPPPSGSNPLLGCRVVDVPTGAPFGSLDVVAATHGGVRVAGWAVDPDTSASIDVHVYVNGAGVAIRADGTRPDVAAAFPGYGAAHGYDRVVPAASGPNTVCAFAIDATGGPNTLLGCRVVDVPSRSPFGAVDLARRVSGGVEVAGWAIDPDTTDSIDVHVYVDGAFAGADRAGQERIDVASAHPGAGAHHGFHAIVPGSAAAGQVCVYGINVAAGSNALLACRAIA
ncbi:MAG TPA: S8 family serine peptidase, partial [Acidimicrobiales bacterium]